MVGASPPLLYSIPPYSILFYLEKHSDLGDTTVTAHGTGSLSTRYQLPSSHFIPQHLLNGFSLVRYVHCDAGCDWWTTLRFGESSTIYLSVFTMILLLAHPPMIYIRPNGSLRCQEWGGQRQLGAQHIVYLRALLVRNRRVFFRHKQASPGSSS